MGMLTGKCLCGAVIVKATPKREVIDACHCSMCRKWSAGPYLAMGCGDDVEITGGSFIGVYQSSEWAERVFCKTCGTSIAWRLQGESEYHVSTQIFEETHSYPFDMQVYIDEKPKNYNFAEKTKTMTGAQIQAMFAPTSEDN
ncbi:MAG: GFA family protein [Rhizobiaceae bacterium]